MTLRATAGSFLALAATALLVATATGQTDAPEPRPLLVGVVDLGVVFTRYSRSAEIGRQVESEKAKLDERSRAQEHAIQKLREDVDAAPEGTAAWREKVAALKVAEKEHEAMKAEAERIVVQRFEALTLRAIDEIDECVHAYAKTHHFDLILKTTTKGWGEKTLPERIYRAQVSTVVAYDPKLDVTEAIIGALNRGHGEKKDEGAY